jgi:hypothetical protein
MTDKITIDGKWRMYQTAPNGLWKEVGGFDSNRYNPTQKFREDHTWMSQDCFTTYEVTVLLKREVEMIGAGAQYFRQRRCRYLGYNRTLREVPLRLIEFKREKHEAAWRLATVNTNWFYNWLQQREMERQRENAAKAADERTKLYLDEYKAYIIKKMRDRDSGYTVDTLDWLSVE